MSLPITENFKSIINDVTKKPQLILEIDGLPLFSSTPPQKIAQYGDDIVYGQSGLYYGGVINDNSAYPYIILEKSTNQITQQVLVDKGGYSSVTNFDVSLLDKDQLITAMVSPGNTVEDIISKKAKLYLSVEGAAHPIDSVLFFSGIVSGVSCGAGFVNINLSSPERLKNLNIFPKLSTELSAAINSSVTIIPVASTTNFSSPADNGTLRSYLIVGDEIIEYTGMTSTSFTGCVRGQFGTIAENHAINDNVESAYRLAGNLRDLSLKLMMSGLNTPYLENSEILSINNYGLLNISNAIFVSKYNFDQYYGVTSGDSITISGAFNAANNGTTTVNSIVTTDVGSYLVLNKTLITEGAGATFSLTSKYAVLPKFCGLEMTPDQVDVVRFEEIYNSFSANFFEYDFFIKDEINGADFINTEIFYPSGCYALPRKAKTSLGTTTPPLGQVNTKKIDSSNIIQASSLKINRDISKNFYNAVVIKYDLDQVQDKFKRGKITQSATSTNRIKVANKPITIEAQGVRVENAFEQKFNIISRRLLERYQFAAESIEISVNYATGFDIEIGDVVILDGTELSLSDTKNASRNFSPRLFEVINKTLNLKGTPIRFSLTDTAYSVNGRYGTVSPSSKIAIGSTTTNLKLKKSFGTNLGFASEGFKWRNFSGYSVNVRSIDYSYFQTSKIVGIDPANDDGILIDPALPSAPLENYIVDIVKYPTDTSPEIEAIYKNIYVYFDKQVPVVNGISQTQFTVSAPNVSKLKVGDVLLVHNKSFTNLSVERNITDITGVTITVDGALGYVPNLDDRIELLGFADSGKPYRIL